MAGCPSSYQPTRIREETLESGGPLQRKFMYTQNLKKNLKFSNMIMLSYPTLEHGQNIIDDQNGSSPTTSST